MQSVKRLLVILDVNDYDDKVLNFVNRISPVLKTEHISFLHVAENLDIPKKILEKYPGLVPSIDESLNQAIEERIEAFDHIKSHTSIEVKTAEGPRLDVVSHYIRDNDIDLLVLGRSDSSEQEVDFIQKMIRRSSCSVALVPPTVSNSIDNILVPMDFSQNSYMSLELASQLSSQHPEMHVHGLHIYKLPHGYFKTGLSKDEFIEEMVTNAQQEFEQFIERCTMDRKRLTMHYRMQNGDGIPYMINRFAFSNKIDAIVLGSRGGNTLSTFFLGRVTEALIDRDQYLPMFVVKNKGENLKIWEAIS